MAASSSRTPASCPMSSTSVLGDQYHREPRFDAADRHWIPVRRSRWLNERGTRRSLQGLDKAATRDRTAMSRVVLCRHQLQHPAATDRGRQ